MTRVAVTGGSGKLGRAVVDELLAHDFDVVNMDRVPPRERRCPFSQIDLTDYGQVVDAFTGVDGRYPSHPGRRPPNSPSLDAVVHLAAIPAPGLTASATTFVHNVSATYHVFHAAKVTGIRRVVWASSETLLGLPLDRTPPPHLPVDEEYPARPETNYALAKHVEETMAAQFCRWDPTLTMVGLRFSNVMAPEDYARFASFQDDRERRPGRTTLPGHPRHPGTRPARDAAVYRQSSSPARL